MNNAPTLPDNMQDMTDLVLTLQKKLYHQSLFIEQLLEQIKLAQHNRFGVKSEAISPDQLRLLLDEIQVAEPSVGDEAEEPVEPASQTPAPKAKRGRRALPAHLPRIEISHTLDDENCQCEHCNERMVPLSEKITEQLDISTLSRPKSGCFGITAPRIIARDAKTHLKRHRYHHSRFQSVTRHRVCWPG